MAIGLALPRNTLASALLSSAAVVALVVIALRRDAFAPTHGLRHVVRLPMHSAVSATAESFWARFVGTFRALLGALHRALPRSTPVPLDLDDELDDEAEAWWGTPRERAIGTAGEHTTNAVIDDSLDGSLDDARDGGGDDTSGDDLVAPSLAPSRIRRLGAPLHRKLIDVRRLFTRQRGEPNVAGDGPSRDAVEAGTLSAGGA
jgi:hypothetical protein